MKTTIDSLLDEMKHGKSSVDVMDILMFKAGVKRKMLQVRLNELFASSYRFMSEGLQWTTPNEMLNEEAEIVNIQVLKKNRENSKFRIENSEQFIVNQATSLIEGENSKFKIAIPEQIIAESCDLSTLAGKFKHLFSL